MSAKIIDYEKFISIRERRGPDFEFYVERFLDGYPYIPRYFVNLAVDQWLEEKDDPQKRIWADAEEINCIIKVGAWQSEVDRFTAKFVPFGIVFRASTFSGQNLLITFKKLVDEEEGNYERLKVWHTDINEMVLAEQFGLRFNFERGLKEDNRELLDGIINTPFLYAEERLCLIDGCINARQNTRDTYEFVSYLLEQYDLSKEIKAKELFSEIDFYNFNIHDEEDFWNEIKETRKAIKNGGIEKYLEHVVWE